MEVKPEYLAIFSEEASDQLREWEECLLALDKSPGDREQLNGMFRAIHTLKGSAGFIGFDSLQRLAHDLESSLSDVRDARRQYDAQLGELLFKGLDLCKSMIESFADGTTPNVDVDGFLSRLAATAGAPAPGHIAASPAAAAPAPTASPTPQPAVATAAAAAAPVPGPTVTLEIRIDGQPREAYLRSFLVKARLERSGKVLGVEPELETLRDGTGPFAYSVVIASAEDPASLASSISIDQVSVTPALPPAPEAQHEQQPVDESAAVHEQLAKSARPEEVVRVSVEKLDTLLNLVGELVIHNSGFIATTQLLREEYGRTAHIYELEEKTEALSAVTRDLQDGIMKARMLPIANVFNRFRRVVRDLAKASGKAVVLDVFGEETEIDKKVIDRIGEPLVHLVRNSVDHGLETTGERVAAGKSAAGTIRLGAYQEGDHICIEVSDDGRGLDRDAILRKALEKGLIGPDEVASATAEKILGFIFLPGFSTARKVSDISGRGVGMDAVKKAVEEMNGNLRVRSTPNVGTTVSISLPLTMAIITAVLVESAGSTYAIPMSAVREILKTNESILRTVGNRRVIILRDEVLALVNLANALHDDKDGISAPVPGRPVVVVDFEGRKIGLEVEGIHGSREVVIKSLSRHYREVEGLIGASILGNGKIALIVDVEKLIGIHHHSAGLGIGNAARGVIESLDQKRAPGTPAAEKPAPSAAAAGKAAPAAQHAAPTAGAAPAAPAGVQTPEVPAAEKRMEELAKAVKGAQGRLLEDVNNQGAIQASLSLSQMTGQEIRVSFPESRVVPIKDVAEIMGGEEAIVGGMYVGVQGDIAAGILLVIPERNLMIFDDLLHGKPAGTAAALEEVDLSGISEMGNILASCFINAMADAAHLKVSPEVPEISVDMCLPVIDSVLARFNQSGDKILLTEASIYGGGMENVGCHQVLFLEPDSLQRLMDALVQGAKAEAAV
jgi:two-component system chemotaxis sensor kinase CheA